MMDHEQLATELERSKRWAEHWHPLIDNLGIGPPPRRKVAAAFQHLGLEHHAAIINLARAGIYGSAFALYRSQFDAFTRGVWFHACASDERIEDFIRNGRQPPKMKKLLEDVEQTGGYRGGHLSEFCRLAYDTLCDFTHGGAAQIRARAVEDEIRQSWPSDRVAGLVRSSSGLSLLGCIEFARLVDGGELAKTIADAHRAIYPA